MATLQSHHIALRTPQFAASKAFYTETLGFPIVGQIPGRDVVFIDIGGVTIELVSAEAGAASVKPSYGLAHLAFQVDDVDPADAELSGKGVPVFIEPRNMGDIRLAFFRDPDGNELELFNCPTLRWK